MEKFSVVFPVLREVPARPLGARGRWRLGRRRRRQCHRGFGGQQQEGEGFLQIEPDAASVWQR